VSGGISRTASPQKIIQARLGRKDLLTNQARRVRKPLRTRRLRGAAGGRNQTAPSVPILIICGQNNNYDCIPIIVCHIPSRVALCALFFENEAASRPVFAAFSPCWRHCPVLAGIPRRLLALERLMDALNELRAGFK